MPRLERQATEPPFDEFAFLMKFYRGEAFMSWMRQIEDYGGSARGHELHLRLIVAGDLDAGASADRWLLCAEALGLIQRGAHAPTLEQAYFGLGGQKGNLGIYPREYQWIPGMLWVPPPR